MEGYHRAPCKKLSVRRQFQFTDCFTPNINPNLYLTQASFVMAHDAATGYLNINNGNNNENNGDNGSSSSAVYNSEYDGVDNMNYNDKDDANNNNNNNNNNGYNYPSRWNTITTKLLSLYGKTQVGTVYDQLNDGARALDLRPKIYNNGTVGFHHGSLIDIPLNSITLSGLLEDAKQWCNDNPTELVLIFHSELVHEAGYNGLSSQVYLEVDDDTYYVEYENENDDGDDGVNDDDVANNNDQADDDAQAGDDDVDDANAANDDGQQQQQQQQQFQYYYSGIAKMKEIYASAGVPYYSCDKMSGLTVGEAMTMADLSETGGKGYLLAVDRHDMYG